ncbi:hypothetical protein ACJRO7_033621 [Eucalyptus globulus]|uniref:Uncharacterized protein n=1 Tax=Eucalyptus globulus TaxID=34317 RepID=A0ABD3JN41_EUCGL
MKLTCLSRGKGFYSPPCHVLSVRGLRILIDCPIDLSALIAFALIPPEFSDVRHEEDMEHSVDESHDCQSGNEERKNVEKPMNAKAFICSKLWYKIVANLHLWNDAVYVTEVAAKHGKLMMEDLVPMNEEFRQFYGSEESSSPHWMKWEELESLPSALKEIVLGIDGIELVPLSAADIEDCVKKVQRLKYAEVACYNHTISIKPISSGLDIGACNWTIRYLDGPIGFVSNSEFVLGHALAFNYNSLRSCNMLIYSYFSSLDFLETANKGIYRDETSDLEELLLLADESSEDDLESSYNSWSRYLFAWNHHIVPIFVISSLADELLAYTDIITELVCKQRQEKFMSFTVVLCEPLFANVKLLDGERLQVLHWQELCIVFCPHWSLTFLFNLQEGMDSDIALLPCDPKEMKMNVLQCSFLSGIVLKKVQPLFNVSQLKFVVLPEDFRQLIISPVADLYSVLHYSLNETLKLSTLKEDPELEITADLISQLHITRLKGNLFTSDARRWILPSDELSCSKSEPPWLFGALDLQRILVQNNVTDGLSNTRILHIDAPSEATLEIRSTSTLISAVNEESALRISDAVDSILDGISRLICTLDLEMS